MNCLVLSGNAISTAARAAMLARAFLTITCAAITHCLTIHRQTIEPDIGTHLLEELPPLFIVCNLTDIVTITAPTTYNDSLYYLYSPNNDVRHLEITAPIKETHDNASINELTKHTNSDIKAIQNNYNVKNVNFRKKIDSKTNDTFGENGNEFVIGPVGEQDHGNWVLSVYYKKNGSWVEMFQVITIQIIEHVPMRQSPPVPEGSTWEFGFAYPLPDIKTCELVLPDSVHRPFDRYFREYERTSLHTCTYVLRNLTMLDVGNWTIIGVGNIVYEGHSSVAIKAIGRNRLPELERLVSSSEGVRYLKLNFIVTVGLCLKLYCLQ